MNLVIQGNNIDITSSLKEYVSKKFVKLEKYSRHILKTSVELRVAKNPRIKDNQQIEVTMSVSGDLLKAREGSEDMYASIDMVMNKLERQLKKYEKKRVNSRRTGKLKTAEAMSIVYDQEHELFEDETPDKKIIHKRHFTVKPMNTDEAIEQLETLNYSFFLFRNQDTEKINIIYKTDKKNTYGFVVPEEDID